MGEPTAWDRISELYSLAIAHPPEERERFLRTACAGEDQIRIELEKMLAAAPPDSFLNGSRGPFQGAFRDGEDPPELLHPDDLLAGRFRVRRSIGRGGMGEVYEAFDSELKETVALKVLRAEIASDEETIASFKQEIQISRRIAHPNVCRVFDLARHDGDDPSAGPVFFLTMELLEGRTLYQRLLEDGPLERDEALTLIRQIGAGLQAAHDGGIIHRDLKTANIMLAHTENKEPRAVIMDFGLARRTGAEGEQGGPWAIAGTPFYMAPEQFSGGELSVATDVFAFGIVIHEILTGARPNGRESLTQILMKPREPGGKLNPLMDRLDRRTAKAILRCLEPDPKARYQRPQEVVDEIAGRRWAGLTRRELVISAGAFGTVGIGGIGLLVSTRTRISAPRMDPEADALYQKGRLHARRLTTDDLKKAIAYFQQAIAKQPAFAMAYAGLADAYSTLNDYGGMPHHEATSAALEAANRGVRLGPDLVETQSALGLALSNDVSQWRKAEPFFRRAIELNARYGPAHQGYSQWLARMRRTREAIHEIQFAVAADPVSLPISAVLGWMYYFDRQYTVALEQGMRTVDLDPNFRYGYLLLTRSYAALGRYDEARKACAKGIDATGTSAIFEAALACIQAVSGEHATALATARRIEAYRNAQHFPSALQVAAMYSLLGLNNDAFRLLRAGYDEGDGSVLLMTVYPQFDPIRGDPRYQPLLSDFSLL